MPNSQENNFRQLQLIVLDCDGVLTDGQVLVDTEGQEVKRFSLRDGHGISLAQAAGLQVAVITRNHSGALAARTRKLGISHLLVSREKGEALKELCADLGLSPAHAMFVGDDVFDIPAMGAAGVAVAVADAHPRVKAHADLITRAPGGEGAVREVVDLVLQHRQAQVESPIRRVTGERTYVIAEIGQNHQGDPEIARQLIRAAKMCGVDAVKSQKRDISSLLTPEEHRRPYDSPHAFAATYGEHREKLELSAEAHAELMAYARELGLDFFASPWDLPSARLLRDLGAGMIKIPSAALTNHPLLEEVEGYHLPVIISTGMSDQAEVDRAVELLQHTELYVLQCTSAYPCPFEAVHLRAMQAMAVRYPFPVGLSGHHRGISVDAAAVALGARIIERHFTLDRTWKGTDHAASLEPPGMEKLVRDIRSVERALGREDKQVQRCERAARDKLRGARQADAGALQAVV